MIPIELVVPAVLLAFVSGWLLRSDRGERRRLSMRINPMFGRDWK